MMKFAHILIVLTLLVLSPALGLAQSDFTGNGRIEIIQDSRIDLLVAAHIKVNQAVKTTDGYRIQLFSDSGNNSKARAQTMKEELLTVYPSLGVYLTFKSPNYKVRIGDFRTKLDAQRMLNELSIDFPNAFIVTDQINLPTEE